MHSDKLSALFFLTFITESYNLIIVSNVGDLRISDHKQWSVVIDINRKR